MDFSRFLRILAARYRIVLLMLCVATAAALIVSLVMPKTYKASAALVVNYKGTDPVTGYALPSQLMPGFMATQADIIRSANTAMRVVEQLRLADDEESRGEFASAGGKDGDGGIVAWKAALLLKDVEVAPSRESSILTVTVRGPEPRYAADVANAFAQAYQQLGVQLKVEPSKKAAHYFDGQAARLRERYQEAQQKLTRFQQEHGIINGEGRLDAETMRLSDLSSQWTLAQAQAMEASSRRAEAQGGAGASPDIIANPLIQSLKMQLAQAEYRFAGVAQRYTPEHPQYLQARAERDRLRVELDAQMAIASRGMSGNARILQKREAESRAALEAQKARVLELNRKQDQARVLANERDNAQRAYETAARHYTQASLEGQSNQADIDLLNPAVPPLKASSPKPVLNTLIAMVLGTLLGVAVALLAEMLDRRVRSADELGRILRAPVLGVVAWRGTRRGRPGFVERLLPRPA
jgi:succinoglycan biosynthesis transport protein ExoP